MPPISPEPCAHCQLMRIVCNGQRPCTSCAEKEMTCVYNDNATQHTEATGKADLGWTAFYRLQAKILLRQTSTNPPSHLPAIRMKWAKLRDEVKELYYLKERKELLFTCGQDIEPVTISHLYSQYLKYMGRIANDETGDEEAEHMWPEEPDDVKRFWADVVLGIRIDREGKTKLLSFVPPARPMVKEPRVVEVEYKGGVYELDEADYQFFLSLRNMSQEERIRACLSASSAEGSSTLSQRVQRLTQVRMNGQTYQLTQADHIFFLGACRNLSKEERVNACISKHPSFK